MTLQDAFLAHCCTLSMRVLRSHLRWQVRSAANDNRAVHKTPGALSHLAGDTRIGAVNGTPTFERSV